MSDRTMQYFTKELNKVNYHLCSITSDLFFIICLLLFMVFNATFNNIEVISRQSVLLVQETAEPGENHRPVTSYQQTLSPNVASSTPRHKHGQSNNDFIYKLGSIKRKRYCLFSRRVLRHETNGGHIGFQIGIKLEAQPTEPVSLT